MNPTYYNLEDTSTESINKFLSEKVDGTFADLEAAHWYVIIFIYLIETVVHSLL